MNLIKTYFYSPHEIKYIVANLEQIEGTDVEGMILTEFDIYHTGRKRELIYDRYMEDIPRHLRNMITYIPINLYGKVRDAYDDEGHIHRVIEPKMRNGFLDHVALDPDDVLFCLDADEILDRDMIPRMIEDTKVHKVLRLAMHQFFYRHNWLWKNKTFRSPVACLRGKYKPGVNMRDLGHQAEYFCGSHFSWCMSVDEMIKKLHSYSHPKYRFCAKKEILEAAVRDKTYPFNLGTRFELEELDWQDNRIPYSLRNKEQSP